MHEEHSRMSFYINYLFIVHTLTFIHFLFLALVYLHDFLFLRNYTYGKINIKNLWHYEFSQALFLAKLYMTEYLDYKEQEF